MINNIPVTKLVEQGMSGSFITNSVDILSKINTHEQLC